ncbi:hypothetical protein D039_0837B, partial [Vibrio parahaemolyticus EKP-028]
TPRTSLKPINCLVISSAWLKPLLNGISSSLAK